MDNNLDVTLTLKNFEDMRNNNKIVKSIRIEEDELIEKLDPSILNQVSLLIETGGQIRIKSSLKDTEIKSFLRFAGFSGVKGDSNFITAKRKEWKNENKGQTNWSGIKLDEKSDFVPEKALINPNDEYQKFSSINDCVTKPKPCKNCNCGRATENQSVKNDTIKSSCGKCYLGDAFRCEGCPYRGMPAFEVGEKIVINTDSVINDNNAEKSVSISNNKVKIDLN